LLEVLERAMGYGRVPHSFYAVVQDGAAESVLRKGNKRFKIALV
jgi:hypothetical protein